MQTNNRSLYLQRVSQPLRVGAHVRMLWKVCATAAIIEFIAARVLGSSADLVAFKRMQASGIAPCAIKCRQRKCLPYPHQKLTTVQDDGRLSYTWYTGVIAGERQRGDDDPFAAQGSPWQRWVVDWSGFDPVRECADVETVVHLHTCKCMRAIALIRMRFPCMQAPACCMHGLEVSRGGEDRVRTHACNPVLTHVLYQDQLVSTGGGG